MGTNYYAIPKVTKQQKEKIKEAVDRDELEKAKSLIGEKVHIGKSSVGWEFMFDHNNWEYFNKSKIAIIHFINRCDIYNEYGEHISHEFFWKMIEDMKGGLNNSRYKGQWKHIHKDLPQPDFMFRENYGDIYVSDLCFLQHSPFS